MVYYEGRGSLHLDAALDNELQRMEIKTQSEEEDYDRTDRRGRIEEYESMISIARRGIKRDTNIVKRSQRDISGCV